MIKPRYLQAAIAADLQEKMVFIGGPRQVGKTTLAHLIGQNNYQSYLCFNWDNSEDRRKIISGRIPGGMELIIFDELHKYRHWKNYIKGIFDKHRAQYHIIVTGSARLDLYRRGGDSLMGRYHYFRLHPFSLRELLEIPPSIQVNKELGFPSSYKQDPAKLFNQLFIFGGFPEPFLKADERTLRRFHHEYGDGIVREDIRDIELIRDISSLQILVDLLPERVGSLLSLNTLRENLEVSHKTIALWMDILERFYYHFRIHPFTSKRIRSLKKEPKMYLWDWSRIADEATRLENMVASHLLKYVHFLVDREGYRAELYFLRDREGREIDFLLTIDQKPWIAVEVKQSSIEAAKHLRYFKKKLEIPFAYQVIKTSGVDELAGDIRILSVDRFLTGLI